MANQTKYFKTPFAESGTRAEVPNNSVGGAVGFDTGFGPDYELPQGSAGRKRIERDKYNGLHHSITKNLKQWQEKLYPTWIEDAGTGAAFAYDAGMIVNHSGNDWISNEDSNQDEPGTSSKWTVFIDAIKQLEKAASRVTKVGGGSVQDFIDAQATTTTELATGKFWVDDFVSISNKSGRLYKIVSGGVADGDKIINAGVGKTAQLQEFDTSLRVLKDAPNNFDSKTLTPTNVVDLLKASSVELPYYYDESGAEYIDSTPISASTYPEIDLADCPSLCVESNPNLMLVCSPSKSEAGYVLYSLVNNLTTTNASLATTANDITAFRLNRVQHAVYACVGLNKFDSSVGTWTDTNLNVADPSMPAFNASRRYVYKQNNSNSNHSITYDSVKVIDGFVRMTFASTASSNPAAKITIDGTLYTVNLAQSPSEFLTFNFPVLTKKNVAVTIENASLGTNYFVNFVGFYFSELKDYKGTPVDEYGYYRNTAIWSEYTTESANSDNDYVMREYYSETYGGGYHGGESAIVNKFYDGKIEFIPSSTPKVSLNLRYETQAVVDWDSVGQSTIVNLNKVTRFVNSGISRECWIDGDITLSEEYSTLMGVNTNFGKIESPTSIVIADNVADMQRLKVGKVSHVKYKNESTGQVVTADMTMHRYDNGSQYGGVYIWRVDASYNKLYYSQVHGGRMRFENGTYTINNFKFL